MPHLHILSPIRETVFCTLTTMASTKFPDQMFLRRCQGLRMLTKMVTACMTGVSSVRVIASQNCRRTCACTCPSGNGHAYHDVSAQALKLETDPYDRSFILYNIGLIHANNGEVNKALEYYYQVRQMGFGWKTGCGVGVGVFRGLCNEGQSVPTKSVC